MTDAYPANATGGTGCDDEGAAAARGIANWLGLAAAPTFAIMALLMVALGDRTMAMMCSSTPDPVSLGGMVPMYLLMSAFPFGGVAEADGQPTPPDTPVLIGKHRRRRIARAARLQRRALAGADPCHMRR
jgi:hypothetical protein